MQTEASILDLMFTDKAIPFWSALLGATVAFMGQVVSGAIAFAKDSRLESRRVLRAEMNSAIQLQVMLLDLAHRCNNVAFHDNLMVSPHDPTEAEFAIVAPTVESLQIPYLDRLSPEIAHSVLLLKYEIGKYEFVLSTIDMTVSPYGGIEEIRKVSFSRVGLGAINLIEQISKKYKLSGPLPENAKKMKDTFQSIL